MLYKVRASDWWPLVVSCFAFTGGVSVAGGCGGSSRVEPPGVDEAGIEAGVPEAGSEDGGPDEPDGAAPMDAGSCTPASCAALGVACGRVPDGCGGELDCGPCCGSVDDCPSRPCEEAVACESGRCRYEPVRCGGASCRCDGGDCGEGAPRACGSGCVRHYCDPAPTRDPVTGEVAYANRCLSLEEVGCGLCSLGRFSCEDGEERCVGGLRELDVDPAFVECNGASPAAFVIYLDPAWEGVGSNGSREAPFTSWDEALVAATTRGSRVIVIAGSPTFLGPFELSDGLSILGGFDRDWQRDPEERPRFHVRPADVDDEAAAVVGMRARGIVSTTILAGVDVGVYSWWRQSDSGPGRSTVALLADGSPGLRLRDVRLVAGNAESGADGAVAPAPVGTVYDGADGVQGVSVRRNCGGMALDSDGGAAGAPASICNGVSVPSTRGGAGGARTEARTSAEQRYTPGEPAPAGTPGGVVDISDGDDCSEGRGADGVSLPRATFGSTGVPGIEWGPDGLPVASGRGGRGQDGAHGKGGGGGSSGRSREKYYRWTACWVGGGGGGGGGGGCGGLGGEGGYPGGWSIGLVVRGAAPKLQNVSVSLGRPGTGGMGGAGSDGLPGGAGGAGAPGHNPATCALEGRDGGAGAAGQPGGFGGLGADGLAVGVLCAEPIDGDLSAVTVDSFAGAAVLVQRGCR